MNDQPEQYYNSLEDQYRQAKDEGVFDILKLMDVDKEHSEKTLLRAVEYFNAKNGNVTSEAPIEFLTQHELNAVNKNGEFRANLYCMLLSAYFAEGIENKTMFLAHSYSYSFNKK